MMIIPGCMVGGLRETDAWAEFLGCLLLRLNGRGADQNIGRTRIVMHS